MTCNARRGSGWMDEWIGRKKTTVKNPAPVLKALVAE